MELILVRGGGGGRGLTSGRRESGRGAVRLGLAKACVGLRKGRHHFCGDGDGDRGGGDGDGSGSGGGGGLLRRISSVG